MAETAERARWDRRVINDAGTPVYRYWPGWSRRWFEIRRADGPAGVILVARVPGSGQTVTGHADQGAAEAAARAIYDAYRQAVMAVTGREQESEPWNARR